MATDVFFFIQLIAACVFSPRDASLQHGGVGDRLRGPDCRAQTVGGDVDSLQTPVPSFC